VDSIPTPPNQEDSGDVGACARRLAAMAENAVNVIAIELIAARRDANFHAPSIEHAARGGAGAAARTSTEIAHDVTLLRHRGGRPILLRSGALAAAAGSGHSRASRTEA